MVPPGNFDSTFTSAMREMSRAHYADIWRRGHAAEILTGEDALFYEAMKLHPEYSEYWERAAELGDREVSVGGVNPFLHIGIHVVIEQQIAARTPPDTDQTLYRLTRAGMDRHEALHQIMNVFVGLMWQVLHDKKPFDGALYRRRLRALKP